MALPKKDYKSLIKQLKIFGFTSYSEFIASPLWFEFRKQMRKATSPEECQICGEEVNKFHLHHTSYKGLLNPNNLLWACPLCHEAIHLPEVEIKSVQDSTEIVMKAKGNTRQQKRERMMVMDPEGMLWLSLNGYYGAHEKDFDTEEQFLMKYIKRKQELNEKGEAFLELLTSHPTVLEKFYSEKFNN